MHFDALEDRVVPTTVTSLSGTGPGSLPQEILNTASGGTINFQPGLTGTILLGSELIISKNLTIAGPGANLLAISGKNQFRVFNIDDAAPAVLNVSLSGLTITAGLADGGGGILNRENLALTNVVLSGNTARVVGSLNGSGGGIYNFGTVSVTSSTLSGNSATISGGAIDNEGTANLTNSTVSGNFVNDNGGGVFNNGTLKITNSTFTLNRADADGNGIGSGGALFGGSVPLALNNTLVAGNFNGTGSVHDDITGTAVNSSANNLIGDGTGLSGISGGTQGNQIGTAVSPIDPVLGPLANNGGTTSTHALLTGSPALNQGSNALVPAGTPTDQRGQPRIVNSIVDIGAFEKQNVAPTIAPLSPRTLPKNTSAGVALSLGDDGPLTLLSVSATSNNTSLFPAGAFSFSGSGASRTLLLKPAANQKGVATVKLTVSDGSLTTSTSFDVRVSDNGAPLFRSDFNGPSNRFLAAEWTDTSSSVFKRSGSRAVGAASTNQVFLQGVRRRDVTLDADVDVSAGNTYAGLFARWAGPGSSSMYFVRMENHGGAVRVALYRNLRGTVNLLAQKAVGAAKGNLRIDVVDHTLTVTFNLNRVLFSVTDSALVASGFVGLLAGKNAALDNVRLSFVDPFSTAFTAPWQSVTGSFRQSGTTAVASTNRSLAVLAGISQQNMIIEQSVSLSAGGYAGSVARYQANGDYYVASLEMVPSLGASFSPSFDAASSKLVATISRKHGSSTTVLASAEVTSETSGTLRFEVVGSSLRLIWRGATLFSITDTVLAAPGSVGLLGSPGAIFDHFRVIPVH